MIFISQFDSQIRAQDSQRTIEPEKFMKIKGFSVRKFIKLYCEGFIIICDTLSKPVIRVFNKDYKTSYDFNPEDDEEVGLTYGFGILAKLFASCLSSTPAIVLDIEFDKLPSRSFARFNYSAVGIVSLASYLVIYMLFYQSLEEILPGLDVRVTHNLIARMAVLSEILFVTVGMANIILIIYNRFFIYDFLLYKCSNITLKKSFQFKAIIEQFTIINFATYFLEPVLIALTTSEIFRQPSFFPSLSQRQFLQIKSLLVFSMVLVTWIGNICVHIVPILITYMISIIEKFIRVEFKKQLRRIEQDDFAEIKRADMSANDFIDLQASKMIKNYGLDTITLNFPDANDGRNAAFNLEHNRRVTAKLRIQEAHIKGLIVSSRLFLYRNLAKRLSEIKTLIGIFEQVFGSVHWLVICSSSLLLVQWVVLGIIQLRLEPSESFNITLGIWFSSRNTLISRILLSLVAFVLSKTILFNRCNRLPERMLMLKSQLFKLNLDLFEQSPKYYVDYEERLDDWHEMNLLWSLYDQIARLSGDINFRFFSHTKYGKKCLLLIFSRVTSLILFYLQAIDIYSNISDLPPR